MSATSACGEDRLFPYRYAMDWIKLRFSETRLSTEMALNGQFLDILLVLRRNALRVVLDENPEAQDDPDKKQDGQYKSFDVFFG